MPLSDSSDDSSSDESPVPAKRPRADTYGASSTTSHGSVQQEESDEEPSKAKHNYIEKPARVHGNYTQRSSEDNNLRLSRSSLSENCSSPNDSHDDMRVGFNDHEGDNGEVSVRPSFAESSDSFYNKSSDQEKGYDDAYSADYSAKSKRMMSNMGFKPGKGLGKFEHGRVEPVEASTQKGRRGLGMIPSAVGDTPADFKWTPDESKPEAKEEVLWLPPATDEPLLGDVLDSWLLKGPKKLTIDDEVNFVEPRVLKGVLKSKSIFDTLDDKDLRQARFRSNPYETIGSVIFLNRAAVKMANIDAVCDFMFTQPKKITGENVLDRKEILYFADVCAGPGGFSEYVLYRKQWRAKGFGFTLKGPNDFKLSDFYAGTAETFNPYYGVNNDGNVFDPANLTSLKEHVLQQTEDKGVHFLMADGNVQSEDAGCQHCVATEESLCRTFARTLRLQRAYHSNVQSEDAGCQHCVATEESLCRTFARTLRLQRAYHSGFSVEGQENIQEILSKQLYLCQCLAALMLVRTGGHFVVKLFDVFTPFSVGLLYIMYRCFEKVSIHKPVTSRPANSERYLICLWKRLGTESVEQHLFSVNSMLWQGVDRNEDIIELVPLNVIKEDTVFYEYIYKSNCVLGEKQINNLLKIAAFSKDKTLKETSQAEMKEECLKLWKLPDQVRTQPERLNADDTLMKIISLMKKPPKDAQNAYAFKSGILSKPPTYIEKPADLNKFKNVYDWHMMFLTSGKNNTDMRIFLSCGGQHLNQLDANGWKSAVDLHITMPAKTLIYGEVVKEYKGQGSHQVYSKALHIVDALMLGGIDISQESLTERINQCNLFCSALTKPFDSKALAIRCKRMFNMEQFSTVVNNLEYRAMKRVKRAVTINTPDRINRNDMNYYEVGSVLFLKEIKEPWSAQMSKSSGHKYYFTIGKDKKPRSEYWIPEEARMDMVRAYCSRFMWPWEGAAGAILEGHPYKGISRTDMEEYINQNCKR